MHEKTLPGIDDLEFYLPMGGPPDDIEPDDEPDTDILPAHPDDDHRTQARPCLSADSDIPF